MNQQDQRGSATASAKPEEILGVRQLKTFFYLGSRVLRSVDGVDFSIARGRRVGVVGETGCGKSATAMSLVRLVPPPGRVEPGSEVIFEGKNLVALAEHELEDIRGNKIGVVFQESTNALDPVQRVGRQLTEVLRAHEQISKKEAFGRAAQMLEDVGIGGARERMEAYPHELSGGMRQRVGIALALICRPALLVADEPTTALDVTVQAQIVELLARLGEELSLSVLLISHDIAVISELADEILVMYAGKVVERGGVHQVLRSPAHPYTQGLLAAIPTADMIVRRLPLASIPGRVPAPDEWPTGCRFEPRCPYAFDRCRSDEPPFLGSGDHLAACWLLDAPRSEAPASSERSPQSDVRAGTP